ncbi:MAG: hypothetical protein WBF90_01575 [Rivularia sp. (in: cyanobacteria)]
MFNKIRAVTFAALMLAAASPAIINNTAVAQIQRPTRIASTVLVTANGKQLTQSMVDSYIMLGEFLADHKFTAAEKRWLTDIQVKDFRNNPNEEIQGYGQIGQILSQIKQSRDPIKVAQVREYLMRAIYLNLLAENEVNKPSIMTIVYKYSPIIFADPKYKVVVTKRTIDSLFASKNFVAQLARRPSETPNYRGIAQYLHQHYYKDFSTQQKKSLATAESRWVRLQQAWSKASPQQRQKIVALINQQLQAGKDEGKIAGYLLRTVHGENRTASSSNTAGQFNQAEFNHGMGMIKTFSNMMGYGMSYP